MKGSFSSVSWYKLLIGCFLVRFWLLYNMLYKRKDGIPFLYVIGGPKVKRLQRRVACLGSVVHAAWRIHRYAPLELRASTVNHKYNDIDQITLRLRLSSYVSSKESWRLFKHKIKNTFCRAHSLRNKLKIYQNPIKVFESNIQNR